MEGREGFAQGEKDHSLEEVGRPLSDAATGIFEERKRPIPSMGKENRNIEEKKKCALELQGKAGVLGEVKGGGAA